MTDKPRQTPAEKAQHALDVADRKVAKATARRDRAAAERDAAQRDLEALKRERDYLAQNPALPPGSDNPPTTGIPVDGGGNPGTA